MSNIIYSNITFCCNNNCKNCVSHSVRENASHSLSVSDFKEAVARINVGKDDVWNLNGGEPTLNKELPKIIEFCHSKSKHIILYSNGRNLNNLSDHILDKIERIIVPIYGAELEHNDYVRNPCAFQETINSLERIIQENPDKIDIKILLQTPESFEILKSGDVWPLLCNNKHFSVSRVLQGYKDDKPCNQKISDYAEALILELISLHKIVRFYDFPFCHFSKYFQEYIRSIYYPSFNYNPIVSSIGYDGQIKESLYQKKTTYFSNCSECELQVFCTMIMRNYFCPVVHIGECHITTE